MAPCRNSFHRGRASFRYPLCFRPPDHGEPLAALPLLNVYAQPAIFRQTCGKILTSQPQKTSFCTRAQKTRNNAAERLVTTAPIAPCNALFVGTPQGGRGATTMSSIVGSAKDNGVERFAWLKEVFLRLSDHRDGETFTQAANDEPVTSEEPNYLLPDKGLVDNPAHA